MQDNVTVHIENYSVDALDEIFSEQVVSWGVWPSWSPGFNPCDFHCWVMLKENCVWTVDTLWKNLKQLFGMKYLLFPYSSFIVCIETYSDYMKHA
jgi:hypothetical protein